MGTMPGPGRNEELNQSSRLDLDWGDDEGGFGYGEEREDDDDDSSPRLGLDQIEERLSFASSYASSVFSAASSVESTVELEDINDASREGLRGEGRRRGQQQKQHPQQQHEMNGFGANGFGRNIQREETHSTLDTSSSTRGVEGASKKMMKIKLWDPGESSAKPTVVTVGIDMPSNQELGDMRDLSLGVGQKIRFCQKRRGGGKNTYGEDEAVDISWQPTPIPREEAWQPPFRISKEDRRISQEDESGADAHRDYYQRNQPQPQSTPVEIRLSATRSISRIEASVEERAETSDIFATPVKGLEPFAIPSILSTTVVKRTPDQKVGLAFRKATGTVVVEKIGPGSPFEGTGLCPGYECLCLNGHRLRSARRAAEIVRENTSLTLVASDAPRPPGTMYTTISLGNHSASMTSGRDHAVGMYFKMKHGLVQLFRMDNDSPIGSTSMKVGDFVLAINGSVIGSISKAVEVLSESNDDLVPILYFNMRQLRESLVEKIMGDSWKKEWSDGYDECVIIQSGNESSNPLTLRFKEEGMCELLDPSISIRGDFSDNESLVVSPDHPLNSVVETLNHGIICVVSAIRAGVELVTTPEGGSSKGSDVQSKTESLIEELSKLSEMYKEGLLSKEDFEAIKSKLLKS